MKATTLLEQQHRKVEDALTRLVDGDGDAARTVEEVSLDMAGHMAIEQQLFYPAVRTVNADLIDESYEEHSITELALKRLRRTPPDDPLFRARASVLRELFVNHFEQEEEDLFPAVETAMDGAALEQLGKKMAAQFEAAQKQGFDALVPSGFAKTSADEFERAVEGDRTRRAGARPTAHH